MTNTIMIVELNDYHRFTTAGERRTIANLLRVAFRKGYAISVYDGEEWTVKSSSNSDEITEALATTGEDTLKIYDKSGFPLGKIYLIWGNAADGSELVADHNDEPAINELVSQAGA
jgi:hypothetical protein